MLPSIILFLALIIAITSFLSIFNKYIVAIRNNVDIHTTFEWLLLLLSALLFSYLFYLLH